MNKVIVDIQAERLKQIAKKGYTPEHDDEHDTSELTVAAASYLMCTLLGPAVAKNYWPWRDGFKPKTKRDNLVRAAALIVAEIERLDRKTLE